jgi:CheY-like chemotaxis protein
MSLEQVAKKRILVVDDDPVMLSLTKAALSAVGYDTTTVRNLAELDPLLHAKTFRPDMVLVDVQMPEVQGDELALMLRTVRHMHVPIYLMSALDEDELAKRSKEVGAEGYISKNQGIGRLLDTVQNAIGQA